MRIRLFTAVLALMTVIGVKAYAQDASLYQKYAVKGDADAMYNLAGCYWNGSGGADKDYTMAAYWYEKSAKKNNVAAMHITGYCYLYGIGVTQDWRKAWEYAEKAVKKGFGSANWIKALVFKEGYMSNMTGGYTRFLTEAANSGYDIAQSELGKLYLYGSTEYSVTRNYANAFKYLSSAADNGNAEGMYYLGVCYDNGMGTPKNHDKALEYYERAAQLGDTNAQAQVGYTYLIGDSVSPDYSTAYSYLKAAADKDNAYACGKIGDIYYYGLGVDENNNTAMDMYKKAAGLGDAHSMCQLAYMYGYGIGASEDNALMYKYYKQAAELNYAAGQCGLGDCYMNGYGVTKNVYTAFSWYKKAADQNSSAGLYQLATCYLNGTGTSKNTNQYIVYLRKAADNDYTQAMSALGYEYYSGENVSGGKDLALAIKWFKAAAKNDDVYSQAILGYSYYKGEELVSYKDYDQAFQYLYQAARNSDFEYLDDDVKANIYHYLAGCYRYGRGTSVDQSLASYYTEQAAKYGNSDSQRASGLLRKTYNESDNSPYANGPTASSSSGAQSSRRSSSMGSDYSEQTTLTSNAGADRASQYYVLRKPAQNDNYIKYATSEALDLYNEGVEEGRKGNYSKAFDCYFKSLNGGCDMAANNLAYLYAYGRGVNPHCSK